MDRQPRLTIELPAVSWETARIMIEHLGRAPEPPTFTIQRRENGDAKFWMSKRTYDWLKGVLKLDPRAH